MLRKAKRAQRGELEEPSVVERPAAHVLLGLPNSSYGLGYYGALLAALPLSDHKSVRIGMVVAATLACSMSLYLMHSLLFVTRAACPYCWTAHATNGLLLALLLAANRNG